MTTETTITDAELEKRDIAISGADVQIQIDGYAFREIFVRLKREATLQDLNNFPGMWRNIQRSSMSLRRLDRVSVVAFDESWLITAVVASAGPHNVSLAGVRKIDLPPRVENLFEDDLYMGKWCGSGFSVIRKKDGHQMTAPVATKALCERDWKNLYPSYVTGAAASRACGSAEPQGPRLGTFPFDPAWLMRIVEASRELAAAAPERRVPAVREGVGQFDLTQIMRGDDGSIYLHEWRASDTGDLHDHWGDNVSIVLSGGYWEITPEGRFWCAPGTMIWRAAEEPHRIEIDPAHPSPVSLFISTPARRLFGFHRPEGWMPANERAGSAR
jgi:hypothetical protein